MANRTRSVRIVAWVTPEEKERIKANMQKAGMKNFGAYARRMLMNGQVVRQDFTEIRSLTGQIGKIGSNVNQIAKRANERRLVTKGDIDDVLSCLQRVLHVLNTEVKRVLRS